LLRHRQRRDRISAISGISVSPHRRRYGLYFQLFAHNIRQPQVCAFLRDLLRHLRGPVIVVWDNGAIHGGDPIRAINPDEGVWQQTKRSLANGRPGTQRELARHLRSQLHRLRNSQSHLRACLRASDLPGM
jgi:hypothetical protein